jgi:hypothetical protein
VKVDTSSHNPITVPPLVVAIPNANLGVATLIHELTRLTARHSPSSHLLPHVCSVLSLIDRPDPLTSPKEQGGEETSRVTSQYKHVSPSGLEAVFCCRAGP